MSAIDFMSVSIYRRLCTLIMSGCVIGWKTTLGQVDCPNADLKNLAIVQQLRIVSIIGKYITAPWMRYVYLNKQKLSLLELSSKLFTTYIGSAVRRNYHLLQQLSLLSTQATMYWVHY